MTRDEAQQWASTWKLAASIHLAIGDATGDERLLRIKDALAARLAPGGRQADEPKGERHEDASHPSHAEVRVDRAADYQPSTVGHTGPDTSVPGDPLGASFPKGPVPDRDDPR